MDRLVDATSGALLDLYVGESFDGGGQATIFKVHAIPAEPPVAVLFKQYHDADHVKHLVEFLNFLNALPDLRKRIRAMPAQLVRRESGGDIGCLMEKLDGRAVDNILEVKRIANLPLRDRLRMSLDLALAVGMLHQSGVVHADINGANILAHGTTAYLIDCDGCGVLWADTYLPSLQPLARGKRANLFTVGPAMSTRNMVSLESDRDGLAVCLHTFLCRPANPLMAYGVPVAEVEHHAWRWPPDPDQISDDKQKQRATTHQQSFIQLSPQLQDNFRSVFDRRDGSPYAAVQRASAESWSVDLYRALEAVTTCGTCANDYVATDGRPCPYCHP